MDHHWHSEPAYMAPDLPKARRHPVIRSPSPIIPDELINYPALVRLTLYGAGLTLLRVVLSHLMDVIAF